MKLSKIGRRVFVFGFGLSMVLMTKLAINEFQPKPPEFRHVDFPDYGRHRHPSDENHALNALSMIMNLPVTLLNDPLMSTAFSLLDTPATPRLVIELIARSVLSLLWWYCLGLAATRSTRPRGKGRDARDVAPAVACAGRERSVLRRAIGLSRIGWLFLLIGLLPSMAMLVRMAAYHGRPEHRPWIERHYSRQRGALAPVPEYAAAESSFILLNPVAESVWIVIGNVSLMVLRPATRTGIPEFFLVGRAVYSLLWWYVLGLAATPLQGAIARRRAARDPSSAAAAESEGGDAG